MNINIKIIKSMKNKKNCINYKEKINNTKKGNKIKKSASATIKEMPNQDKDKNARTQIVKPKILNLSSKTSWYQTNILVRGLKFTPTPNCSNVDRKLHARIMTC